MTLGCCGVGDVAAEELWKNPFFAGLYLAGAGASLVTPLTMIDIWMQVWSTYSKHVAVITYKYYAFGFVKFKRRGTTNANYKFKEALDELRKFLFTIHTLCSSLV